MRVEADQPKCNGNTQRIYWTLQNKRNPNNESSL